MKINLTSLDNQILSIKSEEVVAIYARSVLWRNPALSKIEPISNPEGCTIVEINKKTNTHYLRVKETKEEVEALIGS